MISIKEATIWAYMWATPSPSGAGTPIFYCIYGKIASKIESPPHLDWSLNA